MKKGFYVFKSPQRKRLGDDSLLHRFSSGMLTTLKAGYMRKTLKQVLISPPLLLNQLFSPSFGHIGVLVDATIQFSSILFIQRQITTTVA